MVERKVYNGYVFTENQDEKAKINMEIYKELKNKYSIANKKFQRVQDNYDGLDLVIEVYECGYNRTTYKVNKNNTNLSDEEILLICDEGSLCFGGTKLNENLYEVYGD